jgi:tRNA threonylcarbamoyladenosine biosynthesis protein TsaB
MISRALCRVSRLLELSAAARPVLGIDTSNSIASLAVIAGGRVAGATAAPVTSHGAALADMTGELLERAKLKPGNLGAIAVGTGPGSFTGLRVGISYAKGLATATGCAMAGVPSFDAAALAALESAEIPCGRLVAVIVDARKNEIYAALYRVVADGLEKISEELVVALEHLASRIAEDVAFVGDAKAKDAAALVGSRGHGVEVLDTGKLDLRGVCVAAVGGARFARGEIDRAASLEPLYIRSPEATFKLNAHQADIATEGVWSIERKNSFGSI